MDERLKFTDPDLKNLIIERQAHLFYNNEYKNKDDHQFTEEACSTTFIAFEALGLVFSVAIIEVLPHMTL